MYINNLGAVVRRGIRLGLISRYADIPDETIIIMYYLERRLLQLL